MVDSSPNEKSKPKDLNRRRFIKSMFGFGSGSMLETGAQAKEPVKQDEKFFWADLDNGNIGFPTGLDIPVQRPGSVMKLVTAACVLEEGALNPNEKIECTGLAQFGWQKYKCPKAHGLLSVEEALALSCNVYFAKVSSRVGSGTLLGYAEKFLLDKPVSGQPPGEFPDPDKISDSVADYGLGLDKHLRPSALQLLRLSALIARDGDIPHLRSAEMADMKGEAIKLDLSPETFRRLKQGMRLAASKGGTAEAIDPANKLHLAVKTGTVGHGNKFQSWIIGFFPYEKPRHAFSLFAPVGTSHDSAVPLAGKRLLAVQWP